MMIFRLIILILFLPILAMILKRVGKNFQSKPLPLKPGKTVRDPVCGTFLDPASPFVLSEIREPSGKVYFCSSQCQGRYHRLHEKHS